jgi:hypothetical protein
MANGTFTQQKTMIRTISPTPNPTIGADDVTSVDKDVSAYLVQGWVIVSTHFLRHIPEGDVVMWIMVK